jgi:hypothetical protein
LWSFDVVNNVNQHAQRPLFAPIAHESLLLLVLSLAIIVAVAIAAKNEGLADKVDCIGTAAEATLSSVKLILNTKLIDRDVV